MEVVEDLNYDFNYNMFLAKSMLTLLTSINDRQRAIRWMRKLTSCNRTVDEMKLRNDFMYYLVLNIQNGELREPFNDNPLPGALPEIAHLLPGGADTGVEEAGNWADAPGISKGGQKPLLYQHSPDGGAFLASQPIPRCGAFCYLAVVSRTPKSDE